MLTERYQQWLLDRSNFNIYQSELKWKPALCLDTRVRVVVPRVTTMAPVVEKIVDPVTLGEGPHWDSTQNCLFFVSIFDKTIHKYVPATRKHTKARLDGRVGFILPVDGKKDQFVVGLERKLVVVRWDGENDSRVAIVKELAEVDQHEPTTRLNDGKADPKGRLFAGTMGNEDPPGNFEKNKGALYRMVSGSKIDKLAEKINISNGLAWDLKEKAFYYVDSHEYNIRRYDYNEVTGDIANFKHIFNLKKNNIQGTPDGMTIDTDGNLWIAVFNGSCILKVDPRTGKLLQTVPIPALQVTSVTFGGANMDELFVTTASMNIKGEQLPPCGATFRVTGLGVKGHPNVSLKLD